jgi:hypothetical protein
MNWNLGTVLQGVGAIGSAYGLYKQGKEQKRTNDFNMSQIKKEQLRLDKAQSNLDEAVEEVYGLKSLDV